MANEKEQIHTEKKTANITSTEKITPRDNGLCKSNLLSSLAIMLALLVFLVSIYLFCQNKYLKNELLTVQNNFALKLQKLAQAQNQFQETINIQNEDVAKIETKFQTQFTHLNQELQSALKQRFYQNQDWLLLKARYYLELAQINAHWTNSFAATVELLTQADKLLKQLNGPQIFNIRQALAKDVAQIQSLPVVDISGVLSQLDAAQNSINDLSIVFPNSEKPSSAPNKEVSSSNSTWRVQLQNTFNILEKLVVIRRHEQEIEPLMSPLYQTLIKEKLKLNLQEAQWAVLNNEPSVYQLVLKQAINTLKINFNENLPSITALTKKLMELQKINLLRKNPEVDSALPLLNELIETKTPERQFSNGEEGGNQ